MGPGKRRLTRARRTHKDDQRQFGNLYFHGSARLEQGHLSGCTQSCIGVAYPVEASRVTESIRDGICPCPEFIPGPFEAMVRMPKLSARQCLELNVEFGIRCSDERRLRVCLLKKDPLKCTQSCHVKMFDNLNYRRKVKPLQSAIAIHEGTVDQFNAVSKGRCKLLKAQSVSGPFERAEGYVHTDNPVELSLLYELRISFPSPQPKSMTDFAPISRTMSEMWVMRCELRLILVSSASSRPGAIRAGVASSSDSTSASVASRSTASCARLLRCLRYRCAICSFAGCVGSQSPPRRNSLSTSSSRTGISTLMWLSRS